MRTVAERSLMTVCCGPLAQALDRIGDILLQGDYRLAHLVGFSEDGR
jgi:hypothetical protein